MEMSKSDFQKLVPTNRLWNYPLEQKSQMNPCYLYLSLSDNRRVQAELQTFHKYRRLQICSGINYLVPFIKGVDSGEKVIFVIPGLHEVSTTVPTIVAAF
jgi:hypothetical protein